MDILKFVNGALDSMEKYNEMGHKLEHKLLNAEELVIESIVNTFDKGDYSNPHIKLTLRAEVDDETKKLICEFLGIKVVNPGLVITTLLGDKLSTRIMHITSNSQILHSLSMNYIKNSDAEKQLMIKVNEAYTKAIGATPAQPKGNDGDFRLILDKQEFMTYTCNGKEITEETYRTLSDTNIPGVELRADICNKYTINGNEVTVDVYGKILDICSSVQVYYKD